MTRKVNRKTSGANTEVVDPTVEGEENTPCDRLSSAEEGGENSCSDPSFVGNFSKKKQRFRPPISQAYLKSLCWQNPFKSFLTTI